MAIFRTAISVIFFLLVAGILCEIAFANLAPLATPNPTPDEQRNLGMPPFFAAFIMFLPILICSVVSRFIMGWAATPKYAWKVVALSVGFAVFLLVFLSPDDWGNYRGGIWVAAPSGEQTAYDIWSVVGAVVGFYLPYLRWMFPKK